MRTMVPGPRSGREGMDVPGAEPDTRLVPRFRRTRSPRLPPGLRPYVVPFIVSVALHAVLFAISCIGLRSIEGVDRGDPSSTYGQNEFTVTLIAGPRGEIRAGDGNRRPAGGRKKSEKRAASAERDPVEETESPGSASVGVSGTALRDSPAGGDREKGEDVAGQKIGRKGESESAVDSSPSTGYPVDGDSKPGYGGTRGANEPREDTRRTDGSYSPPVPRSEIKPVYPRRLRERGIGGVVLVRVRVDESGALLGVSIVETSGHTEMDRSAIDAIEKISFFPASEHGTAVESSVIVSIRFVLE